MMAQHSRDDSETGAEDLGPLAWVLDETRKSIEAAAKALKRYAREAQAARGVDLESVDANPLRVARQQLHQVEGALEMVGQTLAARMVSGMEGVVQRFIAKPQEVDQKSVAAQEAAGFALIEYLESQLSGRPRSALGLFAQYRQVQELAGADRIHPADLWDWSWQWAVPQLPRAAHKLDYSGQVRQRMDRNILRIMRGDDTGAAVKLGTISLGLAAGEDRHRHAHPAAFWTLAAGFFEALGGTCIPLDLYAKRAIARVLLQYTTLAAGDGMVSERLAQDLLFFCAQAQPTDADLPALAAVRAAWGLDGYTLVDYSQPMFGLYDPAVLAQARRRVDAIKENWSALAGGDMVRLKACTDQLDLVTESLSRLLPKAQPLADELKAVLAQIARAGRPPSPELAMETATAVLFLEASFADFHPADAVLGTRMEQLAQRLKAVREGAAVQPLEPWMEALYREVSDRQTMGTVVGELRVTMGEVEARLDQFFRHPADKTPLAQVPDLMNQMRGVLSVLGLDQAVRAVARMREQAEELIADDGGQAGQVSGVSDKLGNSLGSLGFLVDMLGYQPALARQLFVYDADSGELKTRIERAGTKPAFMVQAADSAAAAPATGKEKRTTPPHMVSVPAASPLEVDKIELDFDLSEPGSLSAAAPPPLTGQEPAPAPSAQPALQALTAVTPALQDQLERIAAQAALEEKPALVTAASRAIVAANQQDAAELAAALQTVNTLRGAVPASSPALAAADAARSQIPQDGDEDLLGIFLAEAREVIAGGQTAIETLAATPEDLEQKTILRRAFHTLKGSSRMVGLAEFGEAAWALEQVLNTWLAEQKPVAEDLRNLSAQALDALGRWVDDIAAGNAAHWSSAPFRQAADALRLHGQSVPLDQNGEAALPAQTQAPSAAASASPVAALEPSDTRSSAPPEVLPDADQPEAPAPMPVPVFDADQLPDLNLTPTEPIPLVSAAVVPEETQQPAEPSTVDLLDFDWEPGKDETGTLSETVFQTEAVENFPLAVSEAQELDFAAFDQIFQTVEAGSGETPQTPEPASDQELASGLMLPEAGGAPGGPVQPAAGHADQPHQVPQPAAPPPQTYKQIGDLRISAELYEVYLEEAQGWSHELTRELAQWARALDKPVPELAIARAHSLAGSSATVGLAALSELARAVEHALIRLRTQNGGRTGQLRALGGAAAQISHALRQFAAGSLYQPSRAALDAVNAIEADTQAASASAPPSSIPAVKSIKIQAASDFAAARKRVRISTAAAPVPPTTAPVPVPVQAQTPAPAAVTVKDAPQHAVADNIDVTDAVDADLFPVFAEEAQELLPQLQGSLREWIANPGNDEARKQVKRVLHTLKGSARLAGALRLGEMAHRAESAIEAIGTEQVTSADLEPILDHADEIAAAFGSLQAGQEQPGPVSSAAPLLTAAAIEPPLNAPVRVARTSRPAPRTAAGPISVSITQAVRRPASGQQPAASVQPLPAPTQPGTVAPPAPLSLQQAHSAASQVVRVKTQLLDRLVNQAGEVMTSRSRLEAEVGQLRSALTDLSGNLERLRGQLRDVELQAETQMQSRMAQARDEQHSFDPLEFDRFTRMQEITRMMAESVNDVATVQHALQRAVASGEDDLAAQARQARELQHGLLRTRMVEFESIAERLYRVVRQAAKEEGKQVRLDIVGGAIEVDRGILERMTASFEHLLRNSVVHGIEAAPLRAERRKDAIGLITIEVQQAGNDVSIEFRDDGNGLDLQRIRQQAEQKGLIKPGQTLSDDEIANLVFVSGLTTASQVSGLAGRGVGMDVVRTEVQALGGRIETRTQTGRGAALKLVLPLTTAVTQVVMLRMGEVTVGVPSSLVEIVRRVSSADLQQAYERGVFADGAGTLPFFWGGALLQSSPRSQEPAGRAATVVVFHSAAQRLAMHVDEVLGNQEVVVKALGPQLSRLPGLVAITALASGEVALIYNPVALATVYGEQALALTANAGLAAQGAAPDAAPQPQAPLVLVVDDSITVRRVTQRLLQREGYRVALAADGLQGLEQLRRECPAVVLSDIEMPRMDGFDFVRNVRADAQLRDLPVIMITSRSAEKHREHARQLGVNHYLGKPYAEEELLALIRGCLRTAAQAG